ncbi:hypothetical protein BAUCODRAFT_32268 [Baudoinia panamericana UAMH 10762]|uniref:Uncharacterized protein n=1 Tax=Baudoinia panamericana (strain UAMH 10762) TaxID=717646 RepID=M2NGW5_BAUPA|nr:uncharacterized protein BAUCODRAFT_32268 [Baudoinia panamericana UAMH 10762]EMC98255.1 hypothetical protein BAUCODRAFT_32268 [Baudoinia panamericana UAMH 10762]
MGYTWRPSVAGTISLAPMAEILPKSAKQCAIPQKFCHPKRKRNRIRVNPWIEHGTSRIFVHRVCPKRESYH